MHPSIFHMFCYGMDKNLKRHTVMTQVEKKKKNDVLVLNSNRDRILMLSHLFILMTK